MIKYGLFLLQMRIKDPKYTFKLLLLTDPLTFMQSVTEMSLTNTQFFFVIRFLCHDKTDNWHTFETKHAT
jgi:hypothetical protein